MSNPPPASSLELGTASARSAVSDTYPFFGFLPRNFCKVNAARSGAGWEVTQSQNRSLAGFS